MTPVRSIALGYAVAVGALVLIWAAFRILPARPVVFPKTGGAVLLGNDPWFHLHHARGAAEPFPRLLRWDVGTGYPKGNRAGAAGLFNLGAAAVALVIGGGKASGATVLAVLAWSPLVLGAASLGFLVALARELGGRRLALLALALRVCFPGGELERTLLGFGDYHAAEIALASWGLWAFVRFGKVAASGAAWRRLVLEGTGAALPFALFLFVWFGAALHVAMLVAAFWGAVAIILARGGGGDPPHANRFLPYFAALLLLVAGTGLLFPSLVMVPTGFEAALAALGGQLVLLATLGRAIPKLRRRFGSPATLMVCLGLGGALLFAVLLLSPAISERAADLISPRDPLVSEHLQVDAELWWSHYGPLLPWIALGALAGFARTTGFAERCVLLYIGGWTLLWQIGGDFGYLAGALLPLLAAVGMLRFVDFAGERAGRFARLRFLLPAGSCAASLLLAVPLQAIRPPWLPRGEVENMLLATPGWTEAMDWLREGTPQPTIRPTHLAAPWPRREGFNYPPGAYAVLSHWQYGNLVCALGERTAVAARSYQTAFIDWFLERDETASHARLDTLGEVPYVVLDAVSVCDSFVSGAIQAGVPMEDFQVLEDRVEVGGVVYPVVSFGEVFRESIGARLYLGDSSGMERYRLVHESREQSFVRYRLLPELETATLRSTRVADEEEASSLKPLTEDGASWIEEDGACFCYSGQVVPTVKIYERVPGARLIGAVGPGEEVEAELALRSRGSGRAYLYQHRAMADADGAVEIRVPYPTDAGRDGEIVATGPYRIRRANGRTHEVSVGEDAVRRGGKIAFGP